MSAVHCYSRRLLNPFHGTMQIVSITHGDAESRDGVNWVLYVHHEDIVSHTGMFEIRYGSWNARDGLRLSVVRGTETSSLIEHIGQALVQALEAHAGRIPFPPADRHECWMLSANGTPLALIETEVEAEKKQVVASPMWHPGKAAYDSFTSDYGDAARLRSLVNQRAGSRAQCMWIQRDDTGNGHDDNGRPYPASAFPPLLLDSQWEDGQEQKLVRDFLRWQAPWLLQLALTPALRREYETWAWRRPLLCEKQYQLFPEVIDTKGLKVTRVKARLLGADGADRLKEAFIDTGDKETYHP